MNTAGGKNKTQGDDDENAKDTVTKAMETVPNPPSFYYADIEKRQAKFAKHIKERDYFKRQFGKT